MSLTSSDPQNSLSKGRFISSIALVNSYRQPLILLAILLFLACCIAAVSLVHMHEQATLSIARQGARLTIHGLDTSWTRYSQEVVERIKSNNNIYIGTDYRNTDHGIPNPATYAIDLSQAISVRDRDIGIRIYSAYPFSASKRNWSFSRRIRGTCMDNVYKY